MAISLVHDMAEALIGDITPQCGVSKQEKHLKELDAMEKIAAMLPISTNVLELWREYEYQSSKEARLVKELDKLEMIIQASEYEKSKLVKIFQLELVRFQVIFSAKI